MDCFSLAQFFEKWFHVRGRVGHIYACYAISNIYNSTALTPNEERTGTEMSAELCMNGGGGGFGIEKCEN